MTCIAWDGRTLAADKRMRDAGAAFTTTKIFRAGSSLLGIAGGVAPGMELVEWFRDGCMPAKFPPTQRHRGGAVLVIVDADGVRIVGQTPHPMPVEDDYYAIGSGRNYAVAAMYCGKSAREAVEIACHFDIACGNGIDTLELMEGTEK